MQKPRALLAKACLSCGCSSPVRLLPTPTVLVGGAQYCFTWVPAAEQDTAIEVLYATNRMPTGPDSARTYTRLRGNSLDPGLASVHIGGDAKPRDSPPAMSTSDAQGERQLPTLAALRGMTVVDGARDADGVERAFFSWTVAPAWTLRPEVVWTRHENNVGFRNYSSIERWVSVRHSLLARRSGRGAAPWQTVAHPGPCGRCCYCGLKLNRCPPTEASYIRPPRATVKIAMPRTNSPAVAASLRPPLALAELPAVLVVAPAPAVIATACTCAPNWKLPLVNSLNARSSCRKTIWL